MQDTQGTIDRISPTQRPFGKPVGYHRWSNLLFVHWRFPAAEVQQLLPSRLTVDTFNGSAWVGLVPFEMSGVRPRWFPAVPGFSSFQETNLRTYVHVDGKDPGVWFFSLDASNSLAVRVARFRWSLPYYHAEMELNRTGSTIQYANKRIRRGHPRTGCQIEAELSDLIAPLDKKLPPGQALPGTLEHFLAERYILYAQGDTGPLYKGHVHHSPYPLRDATLHHFRETYLKAIDLRPPNSPEHVLFSEGVDVEIFGLQQAVLR